MACSSGMKTSTLLRSTNLISLLILEIFVLISFEIQTVEIRVASLRRRTCQQFEFPKLIRTIQNISEILRNSPIYTDSNNGTKLMCEMICTNHNLACILNRCYRSLSKKCRDRKYRIITINNSTNNTDVH